MKGKKTGGRQKGTPNTTTREIREAYQELIESNLDNVKTWLNKVSEENPDKALNFIVRLSDYVVPKLQSMHLNNGLDLDNMTDDELNSLFNRIKDLDQ